MNEKETRSPFTTGINSRDKVTTPFLIRAYGLLDDIKLYKQEILRIIKKHPFNINNSYWELPSSSTQEHSSEKYWEFNATGEEIKYDI